MLNMSSTVCILVRACLCESVEISEQSSVQFA